MKKLLEAKSGLSEVQEAINQCNKNYSDMIGKLQDSVLRKNSEMLKDIANKFRLSVSKNELRESLLLY